MSSKLRQRHFEMHRFHDRVPHAKPRRIACLMELDGRLRMLSGQACQSKTQGGCMYRLRVRLYRRFGTKVTA